MLVSPKHEQSVQNTPLNVPGASSANWWWCSLLDGTAFRWPPWFSASYLSRDFPPSASQKWPHPKPCRRETPSRQQNPWDTAKRKREWGNCANESQSKTEPGTETVRGKDRRMRQSRKQRQRQGQGQMNEAKTESKTEPGIETKSGSGTETVRSKCRRMRLSQDRRVQTESLFHSHPFEDIILPGRGCVLGFNLENSEYMLVQHAEIFGCQNTIICLSSYQKTWPAYEY